MGHVGLLGRVRGLRPGLALAQDLGELLDTVGLLDAADDTVVLPDQVADHRLKQAHRCVLASVPEVIQVVLQLLRGVVSHADVYQVRLQEFGVSEGMQNKTRP